VVFFAIPERHHDREGAIKRKIGVAMAKSARQVTLDGGAGVDEDFVAG
jgi:hypothetical protein